MDDNIMRKTYRAEIKEVNANEGLIDMLIPISTNSIDRDGEVIEPSAFKKTIPKFMKHPVLVASHDYRDLTHQIGEWKKLKVQDDGVEGLPKYYINEGNPEADWAFNLASKGVAAFSIGFIPKVWEDGENEKAPRRTYKEIELLEISQVIIPSNREAIQNMRSKSVNYPVIMEMCDAVEKEIITKPEEPEVIYSDSGILDERTNIHTKPEETDEFIRIPVDRGNHEGHRIRNIVISDKEGIKAIYCGTDKVVMTYLFLKAKGWDMEKARAWVKEHEGKSLNIEHDISQQEIMDEIDYLGILIKNAGMNNEVADSLNSLLPDGEDKTGAVLNKKNKERLNQIKSLAQAVLDSAGVEEEEKRELENDVDGFRGYHNPLKKKNDIEGFSIEDILEAVHNTEIGG